MVGAPMNKLKLFVVGELSGDPDKWSPWVSSHLVLAENERQAIAVCGAAENSNVFLVESNKPCLVDSHDGSNFSSF